MCSASRNIDAVNILTCRMNLFYVLFELNYNEDKFNSNYIFKIN